MKRSDESTWEDIWDSIENCTCFCKPKRCRNLAEAERTVRFESDNYCGCNWEVQRIDYQWIAMPDLKRPYEKNRPEMK